MLSSSPKISTVETSCSASTSMHPIVPQSFEKLPNASMPLVTNPLGVQAAPIHSNQLQLPYHSHEHLRDVSTVGHTSTQVAAPCSQMPAYHRDQFVANQYPLSHDYLQNRLYSGCSTQGPSDGVRLSVKQSYEGSTSLYSRYLTQVPTGDDRSYLTPYAPSYPHLSMASPQHNPNLEDDYENCEQCKAIYASEHQHFKRGKSLTPLELTQQGIPSYPEAPGVSAISQQKGSFTGYIPNPDCAKDFEKEQQRRDFNCDVSGLSGSGNDTGAYISDQPYTNHHVGAESNVTAPSQRQQKTVFSRLSVKPQPPPQEIPGPSLNQLLYSFSKRSEQWSSKKTSPTEYVCNQLVSEQGMDSPYPSAEQNLPIGLEEEESPYLPFLDFKRRSKAASLDTNAGNEVSDNKAKRRKLVRPSFGQNNNTASSGKELQQNVINERNHSPVETVANKPQENVIMERNHSPVETVGNKLQENIMMEMNQSSVETVGNKPQEDAIMGRNHSPVETVGNKLQENIMMEMNQSPVETVGNKPQGNGIIESSHSPVESGGNKFYIDLNEPASIDGDLVEDGEPSSPAAIFKTQTENPSELNANKPGCSNSKEVGSKQDQLPESSAPSEKITLDLNITDLNTMDEAKLQAILGSSLLQALDKLRNGKSNSDSEKANKPSFCGKDGVAMKMEMKPDTSTNRRCN
uniref:Uncharacterized protein n=1 Tax=Avena sativa TaxID=4498 RepID=A0ACD5Y649_AVESA